MVKLVPSMPARSMVSDTCRQGASNRVWARDPLRLRCNDAVACFFTIGRASPQAPGQPQLGPGRESRVDGCRGATPRPSKATSSTIAEMMASPLKGLALRRFRASIACDT